jgi:2-C-methyl-D-erythritol 2,4-cyclodiphosphate synthase
VLRTPPREQLYSIQTPQCFRAGILRAALDRAQREGFLGTDESSVVGWAGHPVAVAPGDARNIKITQPLDLEIAELMLRRPPGQEDRGMHRIGEGVDYHRLEAGRRLILGGEDIPFEKGLAGHSDADVLSHAVCDALLGAAALGDIGRLFPDTDPRHRGRSSLEFLAEVRDRLAGNGWAIMNVDATILAQRPKLAAWFPAMRRHIALALGIPEEAVGVKATTTEGMNAEGRGEGISAHAVALLCRLEGRDNRD